jgi:hypothetical protein
MVADLSIAPAYLAVTSAGSIRRRLVQGGPALKKTLAGVEHGDHVVLKVQRAAEGILVIDIVAGF